MGKQRVCQKHGTDGKRGGQKSCLGDATGQGLAACRFWGTTALGKEKVVRSSGGAGPSSSHKRLRPYPAEGVPAGPFSDDRPACSFAAHEQVEGQLRFSSPTGAGNTFTGFELLATATQPAPAESPVSQPHTPPSTCVQVPPPPPPLSDKDAGPMVQPAEPAKGGSSGAPLLPIGAIAPPQELQPVTTTTHATTQVPAPRPLPPTPPLPPGPQAVDGPAKLMAKARARSAETSLACAAARTLCHHCLWHHPQPPPPPPPLP